MKKFSRLILVSLEISFFLIAVGQTAMAVPTDVDGDGRSEFISVIVSSNGSLGFRAINLASGVQTDLGSNGKVGAHVIIANWVPGDRASPRPRTVQTHAGQHRDTPVRRHPVG